MGGALRPGSRLSGTLIRHERSGPHHPYPQSRLPNQSRNVMGSGVPRSSHMAQVRSTVPMGAVPQESSSLHSSPVMGYATIHALRPTPRASRLLPRPRHPRDQAASLTYHRRHEAISWCHVTHG